MSVPKQEELVKKRLIEAAFTNDNMEINDSLQKSIKRPKIEVSKAKQCPFLDTIDRAVLDFDFERLCSVTLSHLNVYACLICGKYFQGRGQKSPAYTHSVQESHRVYLNLETHKFYCLPDSYEIIDASLSDIIYVLNPTFTPNQVLRIDRTSRPTRAFDGSTYIPGIVGLNNIKANDYCNVIFQALSHIQPIRDYFLREENYSHIKRPPGDQMFSLVQRFGQLIRKLWNPRAFKAHVSPHEMLQAVVLCSKKRFQFTTQGDPLEFLSWFLNALNMALNGTKRRSSSIISNTLQGRMRVKSRLVPPVDMKEDEKKKLLIEDPRKFDESITDQPFLILTCDLPPSPLYPDEMRENIIPQVPLFTILNKFNGITEKEYRTYKDFFLRKFSLLRLPNYIILAINRFQKNQFTREKNPTIVNFPVKDIEFSELLDSDEAKERHRKIGNEYDLIANIVHDGDPNGGTYRIHILHKATNKWHEMQDLHVTDILPQMITLSESYIQVWELKRNTGKVSTVEIVDTFEKTENEVKSSTNTNTDEKFENYVKVGEKIL